MSDSGEERRLQVEGYFDESGDLAHGSRVFAISGYFIHADEARAMDQEWSDVLLEYDLPYFHMVDCAHGVGPFQGMNPARRAEIQTRLVELIKRFTFEGYSFVAHGDLFEPPSDSGDVYTYFVDAAVNSFEKILEANRARASLAFFFETGHASRSHAYAGIAQWLADRSASLTFVDKSQTRLIQAADLLAWHTSKYVKDRHANARPPRKDFLNLMEHPHIIFHFTTDGGELAVGIEMWPLNRRSPTTSFITKHTEDPVVLFMEEGDDTPIMFVNDTIGWRLGGNRMVYVAFADMSGSNRLALGFDEMRLFEALQAMLAATATYEGSDRIFSVSADALVPLHKDENGSLLRVILKGGGHIDFHFPRQAPDPPGTAEAE